MNIRQILLLSFCCCCGAFAEINESALCKTLADPNSTWENRDQARQTLLAQGTDASVPLLAEQLNAENTFDNAFFLLSSFGTPTANAALESALKGGKLTPNQQIAILDFMGRHGLGNCVGYAVDQANNSTNQSVKAAAARYLAFFANADTIRRLERPDNARAATDYLIAARRAEANAVEEAITLFTDLYLATDVPDNIRLAALCGLISTDHRNLDRWVIEGMASPRENWRGTAADRICGLPPKTIRKSFADWLEILPADSIEILLRAIIHHQVPGGRRIMLRVLKDTHFPHLRQIAVDGLGVFGEERDVATLIRMLNSEESPELSDVARKALITMECPEADRILMDALHRNSGNTKTFQSIIDIVTIRNPQGLAGKLLPFIRSNDPQLYTPAFTALSRQAGQKELHDIIAAVAGSKDAQYVQAAEKTVLKLAGNFHQEIPPLLIKALDQAENMIPEAQQLLIRGLGVADENADSRDKLIKLATSLNNETADVAIRVLCKSEDPTAMDTLFGLSRDYPSDKMKSLALRSALKLFERKQHPERYAKMLWDSEPRIRYPEERNLWLNACGAVATAEAKEKIKPFLDQPEYRSEASRALRRIAIRIPDNTPDPRAAGATVSPITFVPHRISAYKTEACGVADFNKDGLMDIVSLPYLYLAPDFKPIKISETDMFIGADGKGYAKDFMNLPLDVDHDGNTDIISGCWFNQETWWLKNRLPDTSVWVKNLIEKTGNIETGILVDLDGDGKATDFVPDTPNVTCVYQRQNKTDKVPFARDSVNVEKCDCGRGCGDINGDGKNDLLTPIAWYEKKSENNWQRHPLRLGFETGKYGHASNLIVFDVNRDGKNDIIVSSAHRHGIFWYEQLNDRDADGEIQFKQHLIDDTWSQAHYLGWGDIDGDGLPELVTGKRFLAHNGGDPDPYGKVGIYYYDFIPGANPEFRKHIISFDDGVNLGLNVELVDVDGDGDIDLVTTGKQGGLVWFENRMTDEVSDEEHRQGLTPISFEVRLTNDKNLALASKGAKASADSEQKAGCVKFLNDGNDCDLSQMEQTRWHSALTPMPHWAEIKLPAPKAIRHVILRPADHNGYPTSYELQAKVNGEYRTIKADDNNQSALLDLSFDPVTTDTIRVIFKKNANPAYPDAAQFGEIEIFE